MYDHMRFRQATEDILAFIEETPRDAFQFRPDVAGAWTIQEHIVHMADSEVNAFLRLKTIIGSSGSRTFVVDEEAWTERIDAHREDVNVYIKLLRVVREVEQSFLDHLDIVAVKDRFVVHPLEERLNIEVWLEWYTAAHFEFHKEPMERNVRVWRAAGSDSKSLEHGQHRPRKAR